MHDTLRDAHPHARDEDVTADVRDGRLRHDGVGCRQNGVAEFVRGRTLRARDGASFRHARLIEPAAGARALVQGEQDGVGLGGCHTHLEDLAPAVRGAQRDQ